ncbi:HAD-IIA family hydrolase [Aquisphaera insulae]|uniref:HAD-IIA family hydrolase n=1 Tax=Aquisphaera insulae TaxID=2712864 RepID=UPI0013EA3A33|nr:HAD-IIA family hydrolase [Aquisphaera insulae]
MEGETTNAPGPSLGRLRGFAFDLDGTIWAGSTLLPGAIELVAALRSSDIPVVFASNSSRHGAAVLAARLTGMGISAGERDVVAAFDLVADEIVRRLGRVRVLPLATADMDELLASAGHDVLPLEDWARAQAVVVGNDPAFDFGRLRAASRAVAAGAAFFAVNMDARFPVAQDAFDPGCGALVEAVATAAEARPIVIGKPYAPLFERTLERLGCRADEAAMVGDNMASDIVGGRAAGMFTVWIDGRGDRAVDGQSPRPDLIARNLPELHRFWQNQRQIPE